MLDDRVIVILRRGGLALINRELLDQALLGSVALSDFGDEILTSGGVNFSFHNIEEVGWFQLQEDPIKKRGNVNAFFH